MQSTSQHNFSPLRPCRTKLAIVSFYLCFFYIVSCYLVLLRIFSYRYPLSRIVSCFSYLYVLSRRLDHTKTHTQHKQKYKYAHTHPLTQTHTHSLSHPHIHTLTHSHTHTHTHTCTLTHLSLPASMTFLPLFR